MTVLIVQCRLSSTRLPGKALLPLGGVTVLEWTLSAMKKVKADRYFVATDEDSFSQLEKPAKNCGFEIFKGPRDDVLERFCLLIEETKADIVVRATADNPFLFYEAAQSLLERFETQQKIEKCDYMTYTGLPHGSGVEVFRGDSLLRAKTLTDFPYDHEHVGPSLYNHPENFKAMMIESPKEWNYPTFRTTIDTPFDYARAQTVVHLLSDDKKPDSPYTCDKIVNACSSENILKPVLCVPSTKKGRGTGHLLRCLNIASSIGAYIYIPKNADLQEIPDLIKNAREKGFRDHQIIDFIPEKGEISLVVTDSFILSREMMVKFSGLAPLCAVDEGSINTELCDYLLDIIPSYGITRKSNFSEPAFITLPKNVRTEPKIEKMSDIKKILVTLGGEDPADLVVPSVLALADGKRQIVATVKDVEASNERLSEEIKKSKTVSFVNPIHNLREHLAEFDLVVTHYGFTAFESVAAGCAVVLLGTTALHVNLAQKYGFACLPADKISCENFNLVLADTGKLYKKEKNLLSKKQKDESEILENESAKNLPFFIRELSQGQRLKCPVCGDSHIFSGDSVVARTEYRTFRRCSQCGIQYMSWTREPSTISYNNTYFFDDYKKQYGKTYLEDFPSIKAQGIRRTSVMDMLYRNLNHSVTPTVLDIGCAFGPFMDAANDAGWSVFGIDPCDEAVNYIRNELHFPAAVSSFPDFDSGKEFGIQTFDCITMWYVIEHFKNLDAILKAVSKNLKKGGLFAFATPSASGVSAKFNTQSFYENSPSDHYSLWEPVLAPAILKKYGFKVLKSVSTGHHPERFPSGKELKANSGKAFLLGTASKMMRLGDTFEVYCRKERDI